MNLCQGPIRLHQGQASLVNKTKRAVLQAPRGTRDRLPSSDPTCSIVMSDADIRIYVDASTMRHVGTALSGSRITAQGFNLGVRKIKARPRRISITTELAISP